MESQVTTTTAVATIVVIMSACNRVIILRLITYLLLPGLFGLYAVRSGAIDIIELSSILIFLSLGATLAEIRLKFYEIFLYAIAIFAHSYWFSTIEDVVYIRMLTVNFGCVLLAWLVVFMTFNKGKIMSRTVRGQQKQR